MENGKVDNTASTKCNTFAGLDSKADFRFGDLICEFVPTCTHDNIGYGFG